MNADSIVFAHKRLVFNKLAPPTLNDGEKDDNNEEEEWDVKQDAPDLVGVAVCGLYLVTDTTARSHTRVQVVYKTLEHTLYCS